MSIEVVKLTVPRPLQTVNLGTSIFQEPAFPLSLRSYGFKGKPDSDDTQALEDMFSDPRLNGRRVILPTRKVRRGDSNITQFNYNKPEGFVVRQSMLIEGEHQDWTRIVNQGEAGGIAFTPMEDIWDKDNGDLVPATPSVYLKNAGFANLSITREFAFDDMGVGVTFHRCDQPILSEIKVFEHRQNVQSLGCQFADFRGLRSRSGTLLNLITERIVDSSLVYFDGAPLTAPEANYGLFFPGYCHKIIGCELAVGLLQTIDWGMHVASGDVAVFISGGGNYWARGYRGLIRFKATQPNTLLTGAELRNFYYDSGVSGGTAIVIEDDGFSEDDKTEIGGFKFSDGTLGQIDRGIDITATNFTRLFVNNFAFQNIQNESIRATDCPDLTLVAKSNSHTDCGRAGGKNLIDITGGGKHVIVEDFFDNGVSPQTNVGIRLDGSFTSHSLMRSHFLGGFAADTNTGTANALTSDVDNFTEKAGSPAAGRTGRLRVNPNGAFHIWQRGTSFVNPASGSFLSDRCFISFNGTGAALTVTQETHSAADRQLVRSPYFLRVVQSNPGADCTFKFLGLRMADVATLAGKIATIELLLRRATADTYVLTTSLAQNFGTGGSPSSVVTTPVGTFVLTDSWAWKRSSIRVPFIDGKTLGTNPDSSIQLNLFLPTDAAFAAFDIAAFAIHPGGMSKRFEEWSESEERAACKWFFERIGGNSALRHFVGGVADSTTSAVFVLGYAEKRATPSAITAPFPAAFALRRSGGTLVPVTAISHTSGHDGRETCQIVATVASGLTAGEYVELVANNNVNAYIDVSAEI